MILIRRDNFSSRCCILERDLAREDLSTYLEIVKEQFEAEGWQTFWDNEAVKYTLTVFRGKYESLTFMPYHRKVPIRKNWFDW